MSVPFRIELGPDRIIRGDLYPAKGPSKGTLVICHGFKGYKDWGMFPYLAERFSQDLDTVTFNFSHNGIGENLQDFTELKKFAVNTYSKELEDLDAVVQAVLHNRLPQAVKAPPLFLLGHSRGGGVSLIYSFDYPERIAGVISVNGVTYVDIFSEEQKAEMRAKGRSYVANARTGQQMPLDKAILDDIEENRERFDIYERVKTAKVPIVLIQAEKDSERLRAGSAKLVECNPDVQWITIPGGSHTMGAVHPFQGTTDALEATINHARQFMERIVSDRSS
jgi:pimeloyl-ACP methyl ester carboxylesterase